jgi:G3E family GTPase
MDDEIAAQLRLDAIITLVDAAHVLQHLDEVKPEGVENEAVEQIAFADRIVLNKTDLADETTLAEVEARVKAINAPVQILRARNTEVDLKQILDVGAFDLKQILDVGAFDLDRVLKDDPSFLTETETPPSPPSASNSTARSTTPASTPGSATCCAPRAPTSSAPRASSPSRVRAGSTSSRASTCC